jgi:hypothetical protein
MWKWFAIIGAGAAVGYAAVYFALSGGPAPESQAERPAAAASQPPEPVVLSQVVEVTETDSLLDPQPAPPSGIPFDPTEPLEPRTSVSATTALPVAPMPRAAD